MNPRPSALADLSPAYFAMVMATGAVSMASHLQGMRSLAHALLWFNVAAWLALCVLNALRAALHRTRFFADFVDHLRGPGFFAAVAGTSVLAAQFLIVERIDRLAVALALAALVLWFVLTYGVFVGLTVKSEKPPLERGISGTWLLAVVATQSLAVLGALLAGPAGPALRLELHFAALGLWLFGGMLYGWLMTLILYRYAFFRLTPHDMTPPYWINMGAMAISTLAGALLIRGAHDAPFLQSILPFLKGFTVLYWSAATWWLPLLLAFGVWRYVVQRFPLRYDPLYWGAVFPVAMYAMGTQSMADVLSLDFLGFLPPIFLVAALAGWAVVCIGWVAHVAARVLVRTSR
ncbi:MAG TPA: tellurite resistance/C4-dicarboxylate transporter family protein [Caldimonas sp.]|nr:tellurite resistance/C4-dicarboxylate transporter family protein [Caldimonas sp.]